MRPRVLRATNIVLGLLCLMYFLTYIDRVNVSTVVASNEFLNEIPLSKVQIGFVFSAFAYPYLLFQVIGGWVADKFGPRKALTVCGIIWAGATIATGLVHGMVSLFVARVVLGFGEGATFPTATRAMSYWTPKEKARIRAGHHARLLAPRQLADSVARRVPRPDLLVARVVHHRRLRQHRLGAGLGPLLPGRSGQARGHHSRGDRVAASLRVEDDGRGRSALARLIATHGARHGGVLLLRVDPVAVPRAGFRRSSRASSTST